MFVKKKILIFLFSFSNLLILASLFFSNFSLGKFWFMINANSLVGFQKYAEKNSDILSIFNIDFYNTILMLLEMNVILFFGFFLLLFTSLISVKLSN